MRTRSPGFLLETYPRVPSLGCPAISVQTLALRDSMLPGGWSSGHSHHHWLLSGGPLWPVGKASDFPLASPSEVQSGSTFPLIRGRDSFPAWLCRSSAAEEGSAWESSSWLGPTPGTPAGTCLPPGAGPRFPPMTRQPLSSRTISRGPLAPERSSTYTFHPRADLKINSGQKIHGERFSPLGYLGLASWPQQCNSIINQPGRSSHSQRSLKLDSICEVYEQPSRDSSFPPSLHYNLEKHHVKHKEGLRVTQQVNVWNRPVWVVMESSPFLFYGKNG